MMRLIYNIFVKSYYLSALFLSLFNDKAKQWVAGRKMPCSRSGDDKGKLLWFHAASLGEFEQGRPVMEAIKTADPHIKILLTFFSPSGYMVRKDYKYADYVCYLPLDTSYNAAKFIKAFRPDAAVFIKYEYWYNFLNCLHKEKIPYYFISAVYRPKQIFFKPYGKWFLKHLKASDHIFCQDEASAGLLASAGLTNFSVAGDTRFDRVAQVAQSNRSLAELESFSSSGRVVLAGSTWPPDEDILEYFMAKAPEDVKLIIAPHNIDNQHINSVLNKFSAFNPILLSDLKNGKTNESSRVLIIDAVGFLMHLYRYCSFAYVGGGFGAGIHNILEAAAFSKPVIFGPNYRKFKEAVELLRLGGAFTVKNRDELIDTTDKLLNDSDFYSKAARTAGVYVSEKTGATNRIVSKILPHAGKVKQS